MAWLCEQRGEGEETQELTLPLGTYQQGCRRKALGFSPGHMTQLLAWGHSLYNQVTGCLLELHLDLLEGFG